MLAKFADARAVGPGDAQGGVRREAHVSDQVRGAPLAVATEVIHPGLIPAKIASTPRPACGVCPSARARRDAHARVRALARSQRARSPFAVIAVVPHHDRSSSHARQVLAICTRGGLRSGMRRAPLSAQFPVR